MDRLGAFVKLIELDEGVRRHLIELAGGSEQLALHIAQNLGIEVSAKDAARVLGLSPSGTRKRLTKIKGKKSPKIAPRITLTGPKVTRKRPSRRKPK